MKIIIFLLFLHSCCYAYCRTCQYSLSPQTFLTEQNLHYKILKLSELLSSDGESTLNELLSISRNHPVLALDIDNTFYCNGNLRPSVVDFIKKSYQELGVRFVIFTNAVTEQALTDELAGFIECVVLTDYVLIVSNYADYKEKILQLCRRLFKDLDIEFDDDFFEHLVSAHRATKGTFYNPKLFWIINAFGLMDDFQLSSDQNDDNISEFKSFAASLKKELFSLPPYDPISKSSFLKMTGRGTKIELEDDSGRKVRFDGTDYDEYMRLYNSFDTKRMSGILENIRQKIIARRRDHPHMTEASA